MIFAFYARCVEAVLRAYYGGCAHRADSHRDNQHDSRPDNSFDDYGESSHQPSPL